MVGVKIVIAGTEVGSERVGVDPKDDPRRGSSAPPEKGLRAEVATLEADVADREEMWEVASLMESLRSAR